MNSNEFDILCGRLNRAESRIAFLEKWAGVAFEDAPKPKPFTHGTWNSPDSVPRKPGMYEVTESLTICRPMQAHWNGDEWRVITAKGYMLLTNQRVAWR